VMLPDMPQTQMDGLFKACKNEMAWQGKQDLHKATFLKLSTAVKGSVDKVNARVKRIHENPVRDPAAERARRAAAVAAAAQAAAEAAAKAAAGARSSVKSHRPAKASPRSGNGKRRGSAASINSGPKTAVVEAAAAEDTPQAALVFEVFRQPEASRLQGSSQPFPGMPKMPGGYWPPLLSPSEAQDATKRLEARQAELAGPDATAQAEKPEWFVELCTQMEMQNSGMLQIQWQLQSLQWQWDLMQRASAQAQAQLRCQADNEDEEALPYTTPNGARIL